MSERYWEALEVERAKWNKLNRNQMNNFWTNSFVHGVVVFVVLVGGYILSSGGEWQTITLGAVAAGILSFFKGKVLLGK